MSKISENELKLYVPAAVPIKEVSKFVGLIKTAGYIMKELNTIPDESLPVIEIVFTRENASG